MQPITDVGRRVLTSALPTVGFGCEILDAEGTVTGELTDDLVGGTVSHQNYATVHGTCELEIARELDWENVWLRPWQSVTDGVDTVTYKLGAYRPAIPETPLGAEPRTWNVTCADNLSLLQRSMRDTQVSPEGSSVLAEVQRAIDKSQVASAVVIDSTDSDVILDRDMTWVLDVADADSYLRWINDLLGATAYRGLFVDPEGSFSIQKYRAPASRAAEWLFDLTNKNTDIVLVDRTMSTQGWTPTNWWKFVRSNMPREPEVGDGIYLVDRSAGGMIFPKLQFVDVASQTQLVERGDQIVDTDTRISQTIDIKTGPLPAMWHADVVDYLDPQLPGKIKASVRSWTIELATGATNITLEVPRG